MKALHLKYGRVVDFEGSRNGGIRQAAFIDYYEFNIIGHCEYIDSDGDFREWFMDNTKTKNINYWVAHNANVEKNLVQEYTPYNFFYKSHHQDLHWGPWIDTLMVYKKLYPRIREYKLKNLSFLFIKQEELNELGPKLCIKTGLRYHQAMYDCMVTYLLLKRISKKIDLTLFLG